MKSLAVILAFATFVSTLSGGLFALKNRDRLHRILGFTAGVVLGVVAFDILPEIFRMAAQNQFDPRLAMIALMAGFLFFHTVSKVTLMHSAHEDEYGDHHHPTVGLISASALSVHSFLDGVGIGLAFQVSSAIGVTVAIAVIAHDFADGLNTVSLMLAHRNTSRRTVALLFVDALAPVLGAASTLVIKLSTHSLYLYLGFFAGFLLYIGASDILPEAHSQHSSELTILLTFLGVAFIFLVTKFAI